MMFKSAIAALGSLAVLSEASVINRTPSSGSLLPKRATDATTTCLNTNAIQSGSAVTGQQNDVPSGGQSNSAVDTANFINFCSGQTLTNGLQIKTGSCNGIVMGKIPATTNMVSSVIVSPLLNDNLQAETSFNVSVKVANLQLGTFTNATSTYYSAPQDLSSGGDIIGHTHVTVQNVGSSFQFTEPLDATQFVFFKGINDAGDGNGLVTTEIKGGLPAGNYRVCTMSSSANHQPVLMPVAQRGAQDDCRYFSVGGSGSSTGTGSSTGSGSGTSSAAASASSASGNNLVSSSGSGSSAAASSAPSAVASSAAASSPVASSPVAATTAASAAAGATSAASSAGAIGGVAAPAVTDSGDSSRPFEVNGNTFVNKFAAIERACAIQNNGCADAVNSGKAPGHTVNDCNAQEVACNAAQ